MNKLKSTVALSLLILTIFPSFAFGQTRRSTASSRRARRAASVKAEPKTSVARAAMLATTTASGLTYIITRRGTGQRLKAGDTVQVHYTGLLGNGTKFDSSLDRGEPIAFQLGAGRVIKGWDEGIVRLRVGDQATLIIPPQLGYGAKGVGGGVIPPNATLIFIVEVVGVQEASSGPSPE